MASQRSAYAGIAAMVAAMALFTVKDTLAKIIVADVSPAQIIWVQFAFTFVLMAAITAPSHGWRAFRPTPFGWQAMRGVAAVTGIGCFYWTLSYIPIADASAVILSAPLVVTALSPWLLGERVGLRRVVAVVVGFIGVLLILRPGFRGDIEGYLIGAVTGLLYGINYIGNRKCGPLHPPLVNFAHTVIFGTVLLAPVMPFVWTPVPAAHSVNLASFLAVAVVSTGLMVSAFRLAPATVIAPYQYTVIVFAAVLGWFVFGDFPDAMTWAGIALIVLAGLYIALREGQLARQAQRGGTAAPAAPVASAPVKSRSG